jgi:TonB-linked SusC/RagA family outer membrane protein
MSAITVAQAQEKIITGKVTGADDGLPLPQVTVLLKGTQNGVPTDNDGNYRLSVPASGGTLEFRFLGYVTQEVVVGSLTTINIKLQPDVTSLGEVIVTGVAAATPEKKLSFSVGKVKEDLIQQVPASNAGGAIAGKVAGVRIRQGGAPLSNPTIQIRGAAQLRTSNAPLIVVDGILIEGSLSDINMQDVERIEVLKGASAASLYGSRAANGVIQIITRRGNNNAQGETKIRFRNEIGMESLYNSRAPQKTGAHPFLTNPDGSILTANDPNGFNLGQDNVSGFADTPFQQTFDHLDQSFQGNTYWTSYLQLTSRYSGGNIAASFENTLSGGVVPMNDGASRQNLRLNLDQNLNDRLTLSVTTLYSLRDRDLNYTGGLGTRGAIRNLFMMDPSADLTALNNDGTPFKWNVNKFGNSESNPLYTLSRLVDNFESTRFLGNIKLNYQIADGLTAEFAQGVDKSNTRSNQFLAKGHLDITAGNTAALGNIADQFSEQTATTTTATISYVKKINDFNIRTKAFYQYEDNKFNNLNTSAQNQAILGITSYNNFIDSNPVTSSQGQITANNFAVALAGDYKNKYIADFIVRYEGVSLFGENERYQTFFRGSLNYRITEDIQIPGFQELSVRGSYGTSGNRPNFNDQYETFGLTNGNVSASGTLGNANLKNAITTEYEIGLRADFLDRFSFVGSYSNQVNADQIIAVPISGAASGGFVQQIANAGTVESSSIEITLDYQAIKSNDMSLSFGLVWDRYRGEITEFNRRDQVVGLNIWRVGAKIGDIYGQQLVRGLDQLVTNGNGNVVNAGATPNTVPSDYSVNSQGFVVRTGAIGTRAESVLRAADANGVLIADALLGNATPDYNMGLNTTFQYKNLNVYMLWSYQAGGLTYNQSQQWLARDLIHAMYDQSNVPDGQKKTVNYFNTIYNVNQTTDFWIEDATNVRLAELAVNYNFGKSTLDKMGLGKIFKGAKLSIVGRNLLLFSDYSGFDPEVGGFTNPTDDFGYPLVRTFTGAIEFTF